MKDKLNRITLSGQSYPLKCDNFVLQELQKKYGTIQNFEKLLRGYTDLVDKNGKKILNEKGEQVRAKVEPDIEAMNYALALMVQEGLEIEADERKTEPLVLEEKNIIRMVDFSFFELSDFLLKEYARCFQQQKK